MVEYCYLRGSPSYRELFYSMELVTQIANNQEFVTIEAFVLPVLTWETPGYFMCQADFHTLLNV